MKIVVSGGYRNTGLRMQSNQIELAIVNRVTAMAIGTGTEASNWGMEIAESPRNAIVTDSEAWALNGRFNYGIKVNGPYYDPGYQTVTLQRVKIVATGGNYNWALSTRFTNLMVTDATIQADGGAFDNTGYRSDDTVTAHLDRSTVIASGYALYKNDASAMFVGGSRIEGAVASPNGVPKCVAPYNGDYALFDATCQ